MCKRKIHKPGYHSKENFMPYNFNVTFFFLLLKRLKSYIGLNVIPFYF